MDHSYMIITAGYCMVLFLLAIEWGSVILGKEKLYPLLTWSTIFFAGFGVAILLLPNN